VIDPVSPDFTSTPAANDRAPFGYAPAVVDAEPVVAIVTPFLDSDPAVFADAARSVERQSLQQWEWLIVDDGSTSGDARAALSEIEAKDPRVRVVRHERTRGVSAARNSAVERARAPYVLFLDSDDMLEPTTAEKWLWFLVSHPEYAFVDGNVVGFGSEQLLWSHGFRQGRAFLDEDFVGAGCMMRRDVLLEVGGFDETIRGGFEDLELWLRCAAAGYWGHTMPEYLAWYRVRGPESDGARGTTGDGCSARDAVRLALEERYPELWRDGFPRIPPPSVSGSEIELEAVPAENALEKSTRRLLLIQPWASVGGADKFNLDLIAQLRSRSWETTIVTTLDGDHSWLPEYTQLTPDVFALSHFLRPDDYPRFLRYVIRSRQPDAIVISHSQFAYEALSYLRRVAGETPIADYCHIADEGWLDGGYPRMSVDRRELLDLQITSSEALKDWMVARGCDPARVEVCHTNVDPRDAAERPSRAELGLPEGVPIIVYPARMSEQKRPLVFAKTMLELRRRGYGFLALAVGNGPCLPRLREFVRETHLAGQVRCLGVQPNALVQELIAVADCVFIPSTIEGISLAFYEAFAAGVPAVGADVGGQRELVTPECGILVQRADEVTEVRRYADALGELLEDPHRRQAMGEAGRARVREHFTLDGMGELMEELLARAAELAASDPRPVPSANDARSAALDGVRIA
jgi:glycosyltransferase involved in cell wall biosynthesis